jgi:hypothetical protein
MNLTISLDEALTEQPKTSRSNRPRANSSATRCTGLLRTKRGT